MPGRCCSQCNAQRVIPARIDMLRAVRDPRGHIFNVTSLFDAHAMRKQLLDALRALIPRTESKKQPLGRWSLKTCDELATGVNAVYQNRDHCGDVICKTPKRATDYIETNK